MRLTVFGSLTAHAAVVLALSHAPDRPPRPAPIQLVDIEVPTVAPPPPATPPPPPPPRRPTVRAPAPRAAPSPPPPAAAPPPAASAPFATGLELGNGGDGVALPSPRAAAPAPPAAERPRAHAAAADEGCSEPPSKPVPAERPRAIEYTARAREAGIEGRLVLQVAVGADGSVEKVEVLGKVDDELDAAAVEAVRTWRFQPARRCGKAIAGGLFTLARRFELGD